MPPRCIAKVQGQRDYASRTACAASHASRASPFKERKTQTRTLTHIGLRRLITLPVGARAKCRSYMTPLTPTQLLPIPSDLRGYSTPSLPNTARFSARLDRVVLSQTFSAPTLLLLDAGEGPQMRGAHRCCRGRLTQSCFIAGARGVSWATTMTVCSVTSYQKCPQYLLNRVGFPDSVQ